MTTPWKPDGSWKGATVAVLASGPSMSADVAESLREHRTIAVNHSHRMAPWADMLVALDGNWPQSFREFAGMRVTGVKDDELDALYAGPMYERVQFRPGHAIEIRNSGLSAIRIAAGMGAARIILAGFDYPGVLGHFYDDEVDTGDYIGLREGLEALTAELRVRGIAVEHYEPPAGPDDVEIHLIGEAKPRVMRGARKPWQQ